MKAFSWIMAGLSIGVAAYIVLNNSQMQTAGSSDVERAAGMASNWATKKRVTGTGGKLAGKVKEGFGRATGDDKLAGEGVVDQVAGSVQDAAGKAAHAVSDAVSDLNR